MRQWKIKAFGMSQQRCLRYTLVLSVQRERFAQTESENAKLAK